MSVSCFQTDDIVSSPPNVLPRKRSAQDADSSPLKKPLNVKGTQFIMPSPPATDQSSNASPDYVVKGVQTRAASPALSTSTLTSVTTSHNPDGTTATTCMPGTTNSSGPPAKRRKLTVAEKLVKLHEKEEKARDRDEKKALREMEKVRKDEMKAQKDDEKRAKAEEKDAKKREKEHADELKTQEQLKKERAQMRLGAFFQPKPATPHKDGDSIETRTATARRRSLSLDTHDSAADQIRVKDSDGIPTPLRPQTKTQNSTSAINTAGDYRKMFLPFELKPHFQLARAGIPHPDGDIASSAFDSALSDDTLEEKYDLAMNASYARLGHFFAPYKDAQRGLLQPTVQALARAIDSIDTKPIDLTGDEDEPMPLVQLRNIPIKHIHFEEDVRPAYLGTYSKIRSAATATKLRRNFLARARPDTNYDYDSEAEWEPPEEGDEETFSNDDDDSDKDDDGDDDGFLDDSEDTGRVKRKAVAIELIPQCTGLCWADQRGTLPLPDALVSEMRDLRFGSLLPSHLVGSIDPFSKEYWTNDLLTVPPMTAAPASLAPQTSATTAAARIPLAPLPNSTSPPERGILGATKSEKGSITSATLAAKRGPKPQSRVLCKEDLEALKARVVGSATIKVEMLKLLKQEFPKLTNETIKETIGTQFAYVGLTRSEKKWKFVGDA